MQVREITQNSSKLSIINREVLPCVTYMAFLSSNNLNGAKAVLCHTFTEISVFTPTTIQIYMELELHKQGYQRLKMFEFFR